MIKLAVTNYENKPEVHRQGGVVYRIANQEDDEILKRILRTNSMESWVTLSAEREPSYFASADLFGRTETIIAYKDNDLSAVVGMGSYSKMPVHVNSKQTYAGYLGELRIVPKFRNKLSIIRNSFKSVKLFSENDNDISCWFTSIAKENMKARRLLEANLKDIPVYCPMGELVTMALVAKPGKNSNILQCAQMDDVPALVEFYNKHASQYQYSPVLTEDWLRNLNGKNGLRLQDFWLLKDNDAILACFALWDQRRFKQTVVRGYRFPINIMRRPYNLFARLSGRVALPPIGKQINYIFIAFLALDDLVKTECKAVVNSALALIKNRDADLAMLGLSAQNPIINVLDSLPKRTYHTCIESVTWFEKQDVQDSTTNAGDRVIQPEIAIL